MTEDQGHVRAGTSEREHALTLLGAQFSAGRLTPDEFSRRSAAVGAAVTRAELRAIIADLPGPTAIAHEESLADAVERRIHNANRVAAEAANEESTKERARLSAADDLAAQLIELAAYLGSKVPPRIFELELRQEWHSGDNMARNMWKKIKPLTKSVPGFLLDERFTRSGKWLPSLILVPDGRIWRAPQGPVFGRKGTEVHAEYLDLREHFPISIRSHRFGASPTTGALVASLQVSQGGGGEGPVYADRDVRDAIADIAAAVLVRMTA